jgi:hypothetical protein
MSEEHNSSSYYYLQSQDRQAGQPVYDFSLAPPNFGNSSSFEVATVQIPYTWYTFNANMNTLNFTVNGGPVVTATLPVGNYDQFTLPTALQTAMAAVSGGPTYFITISQTSGKMTITQNAGVFVIQGNSPINPLIGFSTSNTASGITQISPNLINLGGTAYIDVYSTELTKHNSRFLDSASSGSSRFLRIPVSDYVFGSTVIYKPLFRNYNMKPESGNHIDIQLRDMYNNVVDLNGRNFFMKFKFHTDKPHRQPIRAGNHNDFYANVNTNVLANKF